MKRMRRADVGRFFVTGARDVAGKPNHFYCHICRIKLSILTPGAHEDLRHYQGVWHFPRGQQRRLETPGWRVLNFEGNLLRANDLERQKECTLRGLRVIRDWEFAFAKDPIIFLLMIMEPRMLYCQSLQRCHHGWKFCNWVALTSWFTCCSVCGTILLVWQPG